MPNTSSLAETKEAHASPFDHRAHLELAFHTLQRLPFLEASCEIVQHLKGIANQAGHPEKFNMTLTLGFLSLIGERLATQPWDEFASFLAANGDLLSARLEPWYSPQRLNSPQSRELFLMPDRHPSPHP